MTITLAPQTEERLREMADREGRDTNTLAGALLAHALEEAEREFEETVAGIERGRQAYAEGRFKPLEQVIAEVRAKHGFSDAWPFSGEAQ